MPTHPPTNAAIARALAELAALLSERGANPHRVQAYLTAADTVRHHAEPLALLLEEHGRRALMRLPGIGERLSRRIEAFIETGQLRLVQELREGFDPEQVFTQLPGIGPELAHRLHDELGLDSMEALEEAAYDGRLEHLEGFGPRRLAALRSQLSTRLGRSARKQVRRLHHSRSSLRQPPVDLLLNVDLIYRTRATRGELPTIRPRRFNTDGTRLLPVLHTRIDGWQFTAVFSNTPRAHELGCTHDWVIVYYERGGMQGQATVVTGTRGELEGHRTVRGREAESRAFHAALEAA